nr:ACR_tran [uncultured bacterium]
MYDKTQGMYDKTVGYLLQRPFAAVISYAAFAIIAVLLFVKWPSTFIPEEDDGYFLAVVQLPPASSLERTQEVGKQYPAFPLWVAESRVMPLPTS